MTAQEKVVTMLTLELRTELAELRRLRHAVADFAARRKLRSADVWAVHLALEEVVVNDMRYAYDEGTGQRIVVRLMIDGPVLVMEVEDDGRPFNPLAQPTPPLEHPLEETPIGGLGIYLVRALMDGLSYR